MDIDAEVRRFGTEARLRRIALNLRLADLAPLAHLSPNYIGKVENGIWGTNPSLGVAMAIAHGLGTNIQDLLGGFKGLTPLGLEAGRICDALPAPIQSPVMEMLRSLERQERGALTGKR